MALIRFYFLLLIMFLAILFLCDPAVINRTMPRSSYAQTESEPSGRWRPLRETENKEITNTDKSPDDLLSLPYLQGYRPAPDKENVMLYDKNLTYNGFNFYLSGHAPAAFLMDMEGRVVHEWSAEKSGYRPEQDAANRFWERAHLFENGDLLATFSYSDLIKIDKDSRLLWTYHCRCNHDLDINEQGTIYVIDLEERKINIADEKLNKAAEYPIDDTFILILTPDGKLKKKISLFELFKKYPDKFFIRKIEEIVKSGKQHVFHTNTIEVFDGRLAHLSPLYKKGNALISALYMGVIAIIDMRAEKIVWISGPGTWSTGKYEPAKFDPKRLYFEAGKHQPTLLDNGHILMFENHYKDNQSRIIELDPLTDKVIWEYVGDAEHPFYTKTIGTNQRLPNNNTLITESDNGRAFEVTPDGKIVWEFYNPQRTGENHELIATLIEMIRLKPDFPLRWLEKNKPWNICPMDF